MNQQQRKRFWQLFKRQRFGGKLLTKKERKELNRLAERRVRSIK